MNVSRKALRMIFSLLILYVIAAGVNTLIPDVFLIRKISTLFLFGLSVCLFLYFSERIIATAIRQKLMAVALMIMFLVVLRGAKYIAFEESEWIARHLWYLYYVPLLMIPLLSFHAAIDVGNRKEKRTFPPAIWLIDSVTVILLGLVITNDRHWLVFRFRSGYQNWDSEYERGICFFLIYFWLIFLLALFLVILFRKCRYSEYRRLIYVPLLPVVFGTVYLILYAAGKWMSYRGQLFGEFPETMCFTMAGIWLSMIRIRFVPSNEGYEALFEASDLGTQIVDEYGNTVYRSNGGPIPENNLRNPEDTENSGSGNIRIHRKKVRGGYVYWKDDITELNAICRQLQETGEQLSEEAQILKLENEMKKEKAQIEAKNRLYDGIAVSVMQQSEKISGLCDHALSCPEMFQDHMALVCVLGTYIKRYANLTLLAAGQPLFPKGELLLALSESLKYVNGMGIPANLTPGQGMMKNKEVLFVYALFENLLEQALPGLQGIYINMAGDEIRMVFEGVRLYPSRVAVEDQPTEKERLRVEIEEQNTYIRYLCQKISRKTIRKAGDDHAGN